MGWKGLHRLGRHICSTSTAFVSGTVAVIGLAVYVKLKDKGPAFAEWTEAEPHVKWDSNWDRRDPSSLVKKPQIKEQSLAYTEDLKEKTAKATRHLILVRHGQYVDSATSDEGRILTALGRQQAEITGQRLRDLDLDLTRIVSSTMTRAVETADIIHKFFPGLRLDRDDILREGSPIRPEPPSHSWRPDNYFFQDGARIEFAFRKYFHRADPEQKGDSVEIIVCHANVIRYFVCRALQLPPEAWLRMSLAHGSLTHVMIRPSGRVVLRCLGNSGHLPPDKVTFS
ncbi:serine/threonine-protein phosphatase PGAM5, mitochondrial-like isoform X2 [Pomacea canaliculata]|uniref:serine/threonine-protein phosphatase PGAM5, mitochondrial-like isoform X2 n=1 Tax=Pomacea canaliculata TaxID=400727 RepID=UPI000D72C244|nr:serine/threonine-protein phosphatase PGAM5, mitochondrial-like isoform X2 [Pomacea canaliculata]